MCLQKPPNNPHLKPKIPDQSNGYRRILGCSSSYTKSLTIKDYAKVSGSVTQLESASGVDSQRWKFEKVELGIYGYGVDTVNLVTLESGHQIDVDVVPSNATITWTTTDSNVAYGSTTGFFHAANPGTATITATISGTVNGVQTTKSRSWTVHVGDEIVTIDKEWEGINIGEHLQLNATSNIHNENDEFAWSSSNQHVATVALDGTVTAVSAGRAVITAASKEGNGIADTCIVTVYIDSVSIEKDPTCNYSNIIFNNSGKIWYCICEDIIYNTQGLNYDFLVHRSHKNYYTNYIQGDDVNSNYTIRTYTDDELYTLFCIDPLGVAAYVKRYAEQFVYYSYPNLDYEEKLRKEIEYKDDMFKLFFNRDPLYFKVLEGGQQGELQTTIDTDDIMTVLSESETLFGAHNIRSDLIHEFIDKFANILSVFDALVKHPDIKETLNVLVDSTLTVAESAILVLNVCKDAIMGAIKDAITEKIKNTKYYWPYTIVTLYVDFYMTVNDLSEELSYYCEIFDHCITTSPYNVNFEMLDGQPYELSRLRDEIKRRQTLEG